MGRPLRIEYAGGRYHVINRGNFRRDLFHEKGGADAFEGALGEAAIRFGWKVHAYVVMRNHFHLAIELTEPNLSQGMQWLQGTWVRRANLFRRITGRPFQDRYKALVIEPGAPFSGVCDYIHLNPARAGVVDAARLLEYPWSSLPKWTMKHRPVWLDPSTALGERGGLPDTASGWQRYRASLVLAAEKLAQAGRGRKGQLSLGWCIGSGEFRSRMKQRMLSQGLSLELERLSGLEIDEVRAEREAAWEERLRQLAAKAKIDLERLPSKKSDPTKTLLAAAMKRTSSASNGWLARRLQMGQAASVSQFVRRRLLFQTGTEEVEAVLSKVKP